MSKFLSAFLITFLFVRMLIAGDTLDIFQKQEFKQFGSDYLVYLHAYNEVKYYTDKDLVKAKNLLPAMYQAAYKLLPKTPKYLGSYYNTKAQIELQSGNQIASSNSFLISIDYFAQDIIVGNRKNTSELSYLYIDLANVYYALELYDKAEPYYKEAAASFKSIYDNLGYATSLNNIGLVYEKKNKYDSALAFFSKALIARREVVKSDTSFYFGHSLKYIARTRLEQKMYDSAFSVLRSAEFYTQSSDYYGAKYILVEIYNLFARYYIELGNTERGLQYFYKAITVAEKYYQNQILCATLLNMGDYFFKIKNFSQAEKYTEKANMLALSKNFFNERIRSVLLLSKIYAQNGQSDKAGFYIDKYDSLNTARKNFIVESGMEALRESVKNRETIYSHVTENNLLQQQNRTMQVIFLSVFGALGSLASFLYLKYRIKTRTEQALIKTKDELLRINEVKDRLFSILAHDLKSPFTALIGYSEILREDFENLETENMRDILLDMNQLSKDTYALLENLLDWSRIQGDRMVCEPEQIRLSAEFAPTLNLLAETAKRKEIKIKNSISANDIVYADRNMIGTVIRNVISNAIKFSYPGTEILITSEVTGDFIEITIKDAGVGMDAKTIDTILHSNSFYTTRGTQQEKGTGLGLMLCREFVETNHGTLRIDSAPGQGSSFIIGLQKSPWS